MGSDEPIGVVRAEVAVIRAEIRGAFGRIEERIENQQRHIEDRLSRHEILDDERFKAIAADIRDEFTAFRRLMGEGIDAAVKVMEAKASAQASAHRAELAATDAKNVPFRQGLALVASALISAVVALAFAALTANTSVRMPVELPPAHSTQERKDIKR